MAAATSVVVLDRGNNTTCTVNLHGKKEEEDDDGDEVVEQPVSPANDPWRVAKGSLVVSPQQVVVAVAPINHLSHANISNGH